MHTRLLLALVGALLIVRLPSLVQPMGPDQGLYAYVGDRILHGELAYRDAWDQKPPGIHYLYAALRSVSSSDTVVPAADLLAAALVAVLLWRVGARLAGPVAGGVSAVIFLLLSDPAFSRYAGVRVRAQCETFIALAVTLALACALDGARGRASGGARGATGPDGAGGAGTGGGDGVRAGAHSARAAGRSGGVGGVRLLLAGLCVGAAFALKYNAGLYGLVVLLGIGMTRRLQGRDVVWVVLGAAMIPIVLLVVFWRGGALGDLYQATIVYNLRYSGETYASRRDMLMYLWRFPLAHVRVDPLWFVGGLGCLVLLVAGVRRRPMWLPVIWVAAACLSIAINGSRGLPQYFLQAAPALALAAGVAGTVALGSAPKVARWVLIVAVAVGVWKVNVGAFPKLAANVWHDAQYAAGHVDRRTHLARYGGQRDADKYSALDNRDLGDFFAARTRPDEPIYVFGFSPAAYVYANRRSASRFFWSRPVILGFDAGDPRYGVSGLLADLQRTPPAFVVLQRHDWSPDVQDSAPFFLSQPGLASWLRAGYHEVPVIDGFDAWERNAR